MDWNYLLLEGSRLDTAAFWTNSMIERRRQNAKAASLAEHPLILEAFQVGESLKAQFIDYLRNIAQIVLEGDWSYDQWCRYVTGHAYASFQGIKWQTILRNEPLNRRIWIWAVKFAKAWWQSLLNDSFIKFVSENEIHHRFITHALRSRAATYTDKFGNDGIKALTQGLHEYLCSKYRDRNAGGITGLSQALFPVYENETKKQIYEFVKEWILKTLKVPHLFMPTVDKTDAYMQLFTQQGWQIIDTANAEKLEAQVAFNPERVGLHSLESKGSTIFGLTKMSGGSLTFLGGVLGEVALYLGAKDLGYISNVSDVLFGGDNWALRGKVDLEAVEGVFSQSQRWLGVAPGHGQGGITITADGVIYNVSLPEYFPKVTWRLRTLPMSSLLQVLVAHNLLRLKQENSAYTFLRCIHDSDPDVEFFESNSIFRQNLPKYPQVMDYYSQLMDTAEFKRIINYYKDEGVNVIDDVRRRSNARPSFTQS
jgi:hypothetical protein